MKILSNILLLFLGTAHAVHVLEESLGGPIFDNTVAVIGKRSRVERQADDVEGSVPDDEVQSKITTTVETTLKTEITFEPALLDKTSSAYATQKETVLGEMNSIFAEVAETTSSEYNEDEVEVTFKQNTEASRTRRQTESSTTDVTFKIPFVSEKAEALSDDLQETVQETVEKEVKDTLTEKLAADKLKPNSVFVPDQAVETDSVVKGEDVTDSDWNSGAPLKICNTLFIATILLKLFN